MSSTQSKFKGTFNHQGEIHVLYRWATEGMAWCILLRALAKKLQLSYHYLKCYFSGDRDNYEIQKVK